MTDDRYFDTCAVYVLGALDADEAAEMRVHVESCPRCATEVARLGVVAEALGRAVPALSAPADLRRRVFDAIAAEPAPAHVTKPARQGVRWPTLTLRPVMAFGSAIAVGTGLLVGALVIAPGSASTRTLTAAVAPASAWHVAHAPTATLRTTGNSGVLVVRGLPAPPRGKIYEVWVERAGKALPTDALFDASNAGGATVAVPGSLHGASAVLVTAERLGGARVPTMAPLIDATLG